MTAPDEAEPTRGLVGDVRAQLVCVVGAEMGRVFELGCEPVVIGRGPEATVCVPGTDVSRAHARITWRDGGYQLEDLESRNGTSVNGVRVTTQPLAIGDRIQIGASTIFVLTRQDELERRARRLRELDALAELVGTLAHDINNVFTVIRANLSLLDPLAGDDDARGALADVSAAAEDGARMVRRLLDMARDAPAPPSEVEVGELLGEIAALFGRARTTLTIVVDAEPDLRVVGSKTELRQVLINLALNARDAMPDGGTLALRGAALDVDEALAAELRLPREGRYVELRVEDTGAGMDAETLARVFEPFFTTKPAGLGTGLGLASVLGIVRAYGGNVLAASTPGRGSTFRVLVPAVVVAGRAQTARAIDVTARFTALLIETDDARRPATARLLRGLGFDVESARSCDAALELLAEDRERFLVAVVDGPATMSAIRAVAPRLIVAERPGEADQRALREALRAAGAPLA